MKALVLFLVFAFLSPVLRAADFYISPSGNDNNNGTLHHPFATLERAKQEIIKAKKLKPVTFYLRKGTYYLPQTLVFTSLYSGSSQAPVTFMPYGDETPVMSGGIALRLNWKPFRNGIMMAVVPKEFATDQFFVNGKRQNMARYPNYNPDAQYYNGFAADAFSKERAKRWNNPVGGYIHAMHKAMWGDYHYRITGKDTAGNVTYIGGWQNNRQMGMHPERRYVENIFEEVDAPGEWYLDKKSHILYFYPPQNINLKNSLIEAVRLNHLIEFNGSEKKPVKYIAFQGITFKHSKRTFMENKEPLLRSDWTTYRGGMIFFNGAENCAIKDCFIDQAGGNAVFINNYNRHITISGCHIFKTGASGIAFIGDPKAVRSPLFEYNQVRDLKDIDKTPGPKSSNYPSDCLVEDCLINETGRIEKQTAGVQIEMSQNITVRHCSIYDVPRAGINIGSGEWGGHIIEWNDVFDTVEETGDHGSFNAWGRDRFWRPKRPEVNNWVKEVPQLPFLDAVKTTIIRNNRFRCDHGWDIDLDDGSSNYLIRNNLCLNGGIKNREGYNRTVENNITVNNSFHPHVWYENSGDVFQSNIIFTSYKPVGMPKIWGRQIDYNFLHRPAEALKQAPEIKNQSGQDQHSLTGDALFNNTLEGDYRVKENSPVLNLGFINFPMDKFGVQKSALKKIARTPPMSKPAPVSTIPGRSNTIYSWLGASVRNIAGDGEVSAYGLPGEAGVLVLDVPHGSSLIKSGIEKDDVIVSCNLKEIKNVSELLNSQTASQGMKMKVGIIRNQKLLFYEIN